MGFKDYFNSDNGLIFSGIVVAVLVGLLSVYTMQNSSIWPVVALLSIAQLLCFIMFVSASKKSITRLSRLFWAGAICIVALYFLVNNGFIAVLSIIWIVQAAELYGPRRASWLLLGSISVLTASQLYHAGGSATLEAIINSVLFGLFQVFALSATQRAIRERQLREQTGALNRELIATRELLSQSTAQSERVRIARDLHDILGHHMTALILNLEVANHSAEGKAQEKVEQSLALAKLLLGDIRTAVSELREDDTIDLQQSIGKLIAGIPDMRFNIDFTKAPPIKHVELAETLLRCTQEGITNVLRHSDATECRISISSMNDKCRLEVTDNGQGNGNGEIDPGNGLKGMAERVSANGGELSWQNTNTGFSLQVELPVESKQ